MIYIYYIYCQAFLRNRLFFVVYSKKKAFFCVIRQIQHLTAKLISSTSWMCASCSQKRKKRLRLFRYPRMVFGVYFLTSISIKYSLIAALIFMSFPLLVCREQRGMYSTAQSMYFAAEKKSVPKTRCFTENQLLFRRKSSVNPAASYARRSARPRCRPACPAASSCCGRHPRWSW